MRIAFAGFRHGHIFDLYERCRQTPGLAVCACAEDDPAARETASQQRGVRFTHATTREMLDAGGYDAVAIGDYYGNRGALAIAALEHGAHVVSDKPFCTSLDELERIERLVIERELALGCMFDLRDAAFARGMRHVIMSGELGEIMGVDFCAHHPLLPGTRPAWYFEDGKHGGIFNDIAIHAFDLLPWLCGLAIGRNIAAYAWASPRKGLGSFRDGGKCLFTITNGAGVSGDVSYFTPDSFMYKLPTYWRITISGTKGQLEGGINLPSLTFYPADSNAARTLPLAESDPGGYLREFLSAVNGTVVDRLALTRRNLLTQRHSLELQSLSGSSCRQPLHGS